MDGGRGVRLPGPDHGLQAPGPPGGGDPGGGMSAAGLAALRARGLGPRENLILAAVLVLVVAIVPLFFQPASGFIDDAVIALAFVVMALGLNVVVGFAGLLDLGYVAFFAIGAYTMGWFGSSFFTAANGSE